jgi:hypothetical protein
MKKVENEDFFLRRDQKVEFLEKKRRSGMPADN